MDRLPETTFDDAARLAREAFDLCLRGNIYTAQELLLRVRTALKRLSGDLPIVGYETSLDENGDTPFLTSSFNEALAWGWLEIASGSYKLIENHAGTSMMHFKRAWRIWRSWSIQDVQGSATQQEARGERARAGLWLGEAWARFMSDRARANAQAILRASLIELERLKHPQLLQETIQQQELLPPALLGSPAFRKDGRSIPYVCRIRI